MACSSYQVNLASSAETVRLGEKVAEEIGAAPKLIFLSGDLGAGKTTLAQGLIKHLLGQDTEILSPTYAYVHRYENDPSLCHFDFYRIEHKEQIFELGLDDNLYDTTAIRLVEWPERIADLGINPDIFIRLESSNSGRRATISYPDKV